MPKTKTRKTDVKRLIDESGNVQASICMLFSLYEESLSIDGTDKRQLLDVGVLVRHSYESAMSKEALKHSDLFQNCHNVRTGREWIDGKEVFLCNSKDFARYATAQEKEIVRNSGKFPFRFYAASGLSQNFPLYQFIDSIDEHSGIYRYELETMHAIAKDKNWRVV